MELDWLTIAAGLGAGLACGFLNTAASSGSAVSLPVLVLLGLDPITANATNRIPVLVGAISGTASFHFRHSVPWRTAFFAAIPTTLGALAGALVAESIPVRGVGLVITAAVLAAFLLLLTKFKHALEYSGTGTERFGNREFVVLFAVGLWLGLIVLDGATYLLLTLTLVVGLDLFKANGVKNALLVPTTLVAILVFMYRGHIVWTIGIAMGVGSIVGGILGARLATAPNAKRYIIGLLVFIIGAELVNLGIRFVLQAR